MNGTTGPLPVTQHDLDQLRADLQPRRTGRRIAGAAGVVALVLVAIAGGWLAGRGRPEVVYRDRPVVHTVTVTTPPRVITRTVTKTATTTVDNPALVRCAQALMGAWRTDGLYIDQQVLPPSAAQGYNPDVSACEAFPAVWNTPADLGPPGN
jgi:hypothetical protein